MRKDFLVVLALATHLGACLCLGGCEGDDPEPGPGGTAEPNKVTGVVQDSQGRPIAGARIRIENDASQIYSDVTTDANGRYVATMVAVGGFKALAWANVNYQGRTYVLRMGMPDSNDYGFFNSAQGAVRNFRWQLSGRIPDRAAEGSKGYFGGTLAFYNGTGIFSERMNAGDTVQVTLEPTEPLIDGSTGQTLQRSFTVKPGNEAHYVLDIPVGVYQVTAERISGGTREPLWVGTLSQQWPAASVLFEPSSSDPTYESGYSSINLYLVLNR